MPTTSRTEVHAFSEYMYSRSACILRDPHMRMPLRKDDGRLLYTSSMNCIFAAESTHKLAILVSWQHYLPANRLSWGLRPSDRGKPPLRNHAFCSCFWNIFAKNAILSRRNEDFHRIAWKLRLAMIEKDDPIEDFCVFRRAASKPWFLYNAENHFAASEAQHQNVSMHDAGC